MSSSSSSSSSSMVSDGRTVETEAVSDASEVKMRSITEGTSIFTPASTASSSEFLVEDLNEEVVVDLNEGMCSSLNGGVYGAKKAAIPASISIVSLATPETRRGLQNEVLISEYTTRLQLSRRCGRDSAFIWGG